MPTKSPRVIPLAGVKNFRDIGGYKTSDGGVVRWGKLFRSGHLSDMTDECGMEMLARDIETVIDFRTEREKRRHPVHWTSMWSPSYVSCPIGGNAAAWVQQLYERLGTDTDSVDGVRDQFVQAFKTIPIDNVDGLRDALRAILDTKDTCAILTHCTAGKDRTGIFTAVLLKILGVPDDKVMDDFMVTNRAVGLDEASTRMAEFLSVKAGKPVSKEAVLPMVGVEEAFLDATWAVITETYGGFDAYVRDGLALEDSDIRDLHRRFVARGDS